MPIRVLMVAGEASGDLHGAAVVRALKQIAPAVEVSGIGGDRMEREGMRIVQHIRDLSFMGFAEVLRNIGTIRMAERKLEEELANRRPAVVVLIDYPGFNLRFARRVKGFGIPVLYYISPQVWAWHKGRIRTMKGLVDRMKVVFPFEVDLYRREGIDVEFVGHPLVEHIEVQEGRDEFFRRWNLEASVKLVGIFPGSRLQEIERILPVMASAAELLRKGRKVQVAAGVAPNLGVDVIRRYLPESSEIRLIEDGTHALMSYADAAIVTSGTATLETGWFGTPMAVVYRTSLVTYFIGRMLVNVPYIGLVNIVAGRKVVPEFIQNAMTPERIAGAVGSILDDPARAAAMRRDLQVIRERLGRPGASERVARGILTLAGVA
ncbi:MAG: lipid-A-disaccharide synthase [Bacteroidota bacterium]